MTLALQPVQVASRHDNEGQLVFADGCLVAVLVRLSDLHGKEAGCWFLEVSFEALNDPAPRSFPDLDGALEWIAERLTQA